MFIGAVFPVVAQDNIDWIGDVGDYDDSSNWTGSIIPLAFFDEVGRINNGGTAIVDGLIAEIPGGIVLGAGSGDSGTLEVLSGGALTVAGDFQVGASGEGHLIVHPGGSLTVEDDLSSGGAPNSSITVGGPGAGMATVIINDDAQLNGNTTVIGPNVDFTAATDSTDGPILLGDQHTLTAVITGSTHSALKTSSGATLGGALRVEFDGHTPGIGESWDLIDASTISGAFQSITSDFVPGPGQRLTTAAGPGGANGSLLRLQLEQLLALTVDRASGAVSIHNFEGGASIDMDGYAIVSPSGSLDPDVWNSLQDQGVVNFEEANSHSGQLTELNPLDAATVAGGTTWNLGNVFTSNPTEFGEPVEDLTLEYGRPDGTVVQGLVNFEGLGLSFNNLVLAIDPESGQGTLMNASPFDIQIEGYAVLSPSGALLSEDGDWNSLQDQSLGAWEEANVGANQLAELNPTGSAALQAGASLDLGTLFDTAGDRDLTLEFFMPGEQTARQGVLLYEAVDIGPMPVSGDYNNNGRVEQQDLDLVLLNWGQPFDTLPPEWENERPASGIVDQSELDGVLLNWGSTSAALSSTVAVPEPGSAMLGLLAAIVLGCWRLRLTS